MAAIFTADYEGIYSISRKAMGVVCGPAEQNQEAHSKEADQELMECDHTLFGHLSAPDGCFLEMNVDSLLLLLSQLNKITMESLVKGCTAGGCKRRTINLKEISHRGIRRILDGVAVRFGHYGDVDFGCWDYEHKRPEGLHSRPGWQLH
uniref:Uncharacterized protein n=1 Tax=Nothobranchius furzeri TaxID=105023 RepID=A0A1A8UXW4_NOTFU